MSLFYVSVELAGMSNHSRESTLRPEKALPRGPERRGCWGDPCAFLTHLPGTAVWAHCSLSGKPLGAILVPGVLKLRSGSLHRLSCFFFPPSCFLNPPPGIPGPLFLLFLLPTPCCSPAHVRALYPQPPPVLCFVARTASEISLVL